MLYLYIFFEINYEENEKHISKMHNVTIEIMVKK